jgi:hypothetical protein
LEVVVGFELGQRPGLDLVVHDGRQAAFAVRAERLEVEVEVAEHAPLESGCERVLELSLHRDRVAELRDELRKGELERGEAELECTLGIQVVLPAWVRAGCLMALRSMFVMWVPFKGLVDFRRPARWASGEAPASTRRWGGRLLAHPVVGDQ